MEEKNNGLTPMTWVIAILGMILLSCFIILPPLFRIVFKDKTVPLPDDQPVVEHMECVKNNYVTDNHYESDTIKFSYLNNRINLYTKKTVMTFNDTESFDAEKDMLGKLVTGYSFVKGASYVVTPNVSDLKIIVTQEFNLGTFQTTSVTLPGDLQPTQLTSDYTRDNSINDVRIELTNSGYTCK